MKTPYYLNTRNSLLRFSLGVLTAIAFSPTLYGQSAKQSPQINSHAVSKQSSIKTSIEDVTRRTKFSKHFVNGDGSFTAQIGGNYHYKDENGNWQEIDLQWDVHPQGIYHFQSVKNDVKLYFPQHSNSGMLKMVNEHGQSFSWWKDNTISFVNNGTILETMLPQSVPGVVNDKKLVYPNLYPSISEEFLLMEEGLENNLILHQAPSQLTNLPLGSTMKLSHFIPLKDGWLVRDAKGNLQSSNFESPTFSIQVGNEDQQFYFGQTLIFDGGFTKENALKIYLPESKLSSEDRQALNNHVLAINHSVRFVNGGIEINAHIPASWLTNSNRQYPVTIDPTVTVTPPNSTGTFYGPMTNWYGFQRHASLYLQSEIGAYGVITALEYNRTSTTGNATDVPVTIHLKSTPDNTLATGNAWNSTYYTSGGQLGFNSTFNVGTTAGWKTFNLTSPFTYENGNLLVMVKDLYGGTGSAKYYNQSTTSPNRQTYIRADGTDPGDSSTLALEANRLTEIRITYTSLVDCSGLPASSTASSSSATVCAEDAFTLSLSNIPAEGGISVQWQSSSDGAAWANFGAPTTSGVLVLNDGQTSATHYRAIITCVPTQDEITSSSVVVNMTPFDQCYCINAIPFNCTDGDLITNVTFAGINNNSNCGSTTTGYSDYTTSVAAAQVNSGDSYPISVSVGPSGGGWLYESVGVWIDYNHDGILDSLQGEYTPLGTGLNQAITGTINIPSTALGGSTRMRVVVTASINPLNIYACGPQTVNENYGEMEDYTINITVPNPTIDQITVTTIGNAPALIDTYQGTLPVQATILPAAIDQSVTWSVVNGTGSATIDANGLVTAVSNGTVWAKAISVYDINKMDSLMITITNQIPPMDSVVVSTIGNVPAIITTSGGQLSLQAIVYPLMLNQSVNWSIIQETGNATISSSGQVFAVSNGTVWAKAVSVENSAIADSIQITISNQGMSTPTLTANSIELYPNPTTSWVSIQATEALGSATLMVVDMNGKVIFEDQVSENQLTESYKLDMSTYTNGVYQIKINGNDYQFQRQIIKQ